MHGAGALGSPALDTDYLILLSLVLHWKLIMNFNSTKIIEKLTLTPKTPQRSKTFRRHISTFLDPTFVKITVYPR
jgi:hypothetical protein